MGNYIEYEDVIAFHPGYYIKELVEESGLTQEDFAKRLDTTPKNLSLLVRGEQSLSIDVALKLSRMLGTSVIYWLNLQNAYDAIIAEHKSEEELIEERGVFKYLDYKYFRENYKLPDLPRKTDEQIKELREFLKVSTLTVFRKRDMAVSFRTATESLTEANIESIKYALTLTRNHKEFYSLIKREFEQAGVILVILPNIPGSNINGATKKLGDNIMLMINDRRLNADSFWFTLFHEIGHIINGDFGISFDKKFSEQENKADEFAENCLIDPDEYKEFVNNNKFNLYDIERFANRIDRDPGIVLGRLQNDGLVRYDDVTLNSLRHKYIVKTNNL